MAENETSGATTPGGGLRRGPGLLAFLTVSAIGAGLDLATKWWAFHAIAPNQPLDLIPGYLRLHLAINTGAAFSALEGQLPFFYLISGVAICLLCYFSWSAPARSTWRYHSMLGLLGAGVLGNLHDRIRLQGVRDFIDVYVGHPPLRDRLRGWFGTEHWPTFNVADAFICVGAVCLFFVFSKSPAPASEEPGAVADPGQAA